MYVLQVLASHICPPPIPSISGLTGLLSSTLTFSAGKLCHPPDTYPTLWKQWPCTNSQSVNRKREVWKDKVHKLDIHEGPAGSHPRLRNHLPVAASCWMWTKATAEECLKFLWTYLSPCVTMSSSWMYSAALTLHHQENFSLFGIHFQSISFLYCFKGLLSSWPCQQYQALRECDWYWTCAVTVSSHLYENNSVTALHAENVVHSSA